MCTSCYKHSTTLWSYGLGCTSCYKHSTTLWSFVLGCTSCYKHLTSLRSKNLLCTSCYKHLTSMRSKNLLCTSCYKHLTSLRSKNICTSCYKRSTSLRSYRLGCMRSVFLRGLILHKRPIIHSPTLPDAHPIHTGCQMLDVDSLRVGCLQNSGAHRTDYFHLKRTRVW